MYNQIEADKKERRKIIAAATGIVVVILILIVAIVVVATKKSTKTSITANENSAFELNDEAAISDNTVTKETEKDADAVVEAETEKSAGDEPATKTQAETTTEYTDSITETAAPTATIMPETGPLDYLPIALILGALAAYLSSVTLAKQEA